MLGGTFRKYRLRISVGIKVAAMVVSFEAIMLVAYALLANLLVDEQSILRFLNLSQQNVVVVTLISSLVLAGYLTFLVITRIFSPVSLLMKGTEEIMKGNLALRLKVKTGDELELLAERFNSMTSALKAERDSLEAKVLERTRALEESQKKELERQNEVLKLKDEFLFVAAHELRTPVTSIRWSLESVADRKMNAELRQAFDDALRAGESLSDLVEDLLNMARLDAKRIPFKKEFVNLKESAQEVAKQLETIASKRKVRVHVEAPEGLPGMALADSRRVAEVLTNLAVNAIKYNREGGNVTLRVIREENAMRVDVADDGPGIPQEEQAHLFEKFWRSTRTNQTIEGSGLGLFITKRLVEGMSGTIGFESAEGRGAVFTVRLPAAKS